jgi:hypothetical protein
MTDHSFEPRADAGVRTVDELVTRSRQLASGAAVAIFLAPAAALIPVPPSGGPLEIVRVALYLVFAIGALVLLGAALFLGARGMLLGGGRATLRARSSPARGRAWRMLCSLVIGYVVIGAIVACFAALPVMMLSVDRMIVVRSWLFWPWYGFVLMRELIPAP